MNRVIYIVTVLIFLSSCNEKKTASELLQETINSMDTIETIYYIQDMARTNPRNINDTIIDNLNCYQIAVRLENKITMPGFLAHLEDIEGIVSETSYFINMQTYYPVRMKGESFSADNPGQVVFIDQKYYDIRFNLTIDEDVQFNTSNAMLSGFEIREMKPE